MLHIDRYIIHPTLLHSLLLHERKYVIFMNINIKQGRQIKYRFLSSFSNRYVSLFLLIVFFILNMVACNNPPSDDVGSAFANTNDEEPLERDLLPQLERHTETPEDDKDIHGILPDPFSSSLTLVGILTSKFSEDNIAIIESGNSSYIVRHKDVVAGYWTVESIKSSSVLLRHDDKELLLELRDN